MILEVKKVSLNSNQSNHVTDDKFRKWKEVEPLDRFHVVHGLFMLMGLMHFVPYTFFVTANAYWMYKFRNVSAEVTDTDARTVLQTHFSPGTTISSTIPGLIFMLASTFFGHKIKTRARVLVSLLVFTSSFILMTGFVKIDTDSWQLGFFILTMIILGFISGANSAFEIASLAIISKFPQHYMKSYLVGQGFAGIFNALLQIISLATATSTTTSGLIYFVVGSTCMGFTLLLFYGIKYNRCYNWHVSQIEENTKKDLITFSQFKIYFKMMWPIISVYTIFMLTIIPTHTPITALVVSEDYGNGSEWNDKYFVPVVTFLYSDVTGLFGRIMSNKVNKSINPYILNIIIFVRMFIFVPLIYYCNALPRYHSSVLLPHDWQYIIILGAFGFSNGYIFNLIFLELGKLVEPEKLEDVFMVFMSCTAVIGPLIIPSSIISVELL